MKTLLIAVLVEIGKWLVKYVLEAKDKAKKAKEKIAKEVKKNAATAKNKLKNMSDVAIIRHAIGKGRKKRKKSEPKIRPNDGSK